MINRIEKCMWLLKDIQVAFSQPLGSHFMVFGEPQCPSAASETPVPVSFASGRELFALRDTRRGTWRQALGGLEAQKLGGSDALILATSWIFLMASGELPTIMFMKRL